jgi:hypothetical protein
LSFFRSFVLTFHFVAVQTANSTSTAKKAKQTFTCYICNCQLQGTTRSFNVHLNNCLNSEQPEEQQQQEYEWNGVTRVMPSSFVPFNQADRVKELDVPDDLNIEEDESSIYGSAQFTEDSIIPPSTTEESFYLHDSPTTSIIKPKENALSAKDLLIQSLKERLKSQQLDLEHAPKCLLCQEHYKIPLTSILCWHVHCEECWLKALGAKKTCPQCTIITRPADLRRIYL